MILNPLLPTEDVAESSSAENEEDPTLSLPNIEECKSLELEGVKLAEEGRHEEALEKFSSAIGACPKNPSPYNNRAQAYRLLKRHDEALCDIEKAIHLSDGKGKSACQAYVQRGLILRLQGKDDEAKADYEKASALGSSFAKLQLVEMNPYAAMCNKMLQDVIGKLQRGENDSTPSKAE
ncbi:Protein F52H3.5 [Aphelenchoides avenae]|nr:Protein F52H3.5 [Aphelenchus avenae]